MHRWMKYDVERMLHGCVRPSAHSLTSFWEDLETFLSSSHTFIIRTLLFLCLPYRSLPFRFTHLQHQDFTVVLYILFIETLLWKKQGVEQWKKISNIPQVSHIKVHIFMRQAKYTPGDRVFPFKISFIYLRSNSSLILNDEKIKTHKCWWFIAIRYDDALWKNVGLTYSSDPEW